VTEHHRLPPWLRVKVGKAHQVASTRDLLACRGVHTVCQEARCPNVGECFGSQTATFMILGDTCTRDCGFCAVKHGIPGAVDPDEPRRVADAAREMGLDFVVVTSVTRDDLEDGGAGQFAATVRALKGQSEGEGESQKEILRAGRRAQDDSVGGAAREGMQVEVLVPDFGGDEALLAVVMETEPTVLNHNVETIERLHATVRPQARYERSLGVLAAAKRMAPGRPVKSGFMVGLGEDDDEVRTLLGDLRAAGCDIVSIGQYLRPTRKHLEVQRYVEPERFDEYAEWARGMGFLYAASGPFVRSSYQAAEAARAAIAAMGHTTKAP
jgi:lipoic acid synthetase